MQIVESSIISNYTIKQRSGFSKCLLIELISSKYLQYPLFKLVFINY